MEIIVDLERLTRLTQKTETANINNPSRHFNVREAVDGSQSHGDKGV